ncbi:MAG: hypothetical protein ACMUIE_08280 [Thermoplasmatota archaeon]
MNEEDPSGTGLERLVSEGLFKDRDALLSFCIAVGVFHGRKGMGRSEGLELENVSRWEIWSLLQLVLYDENPDIDDIPRMLQVLEARLAGGIELVREVVGSSHGEEAAERLLSLLPP